MSGPRPVRRPPVLAVLGGLFALSALGRGGVTLAAMAPEATTPPGPTWSELDAWSEELDAREDAARAAGIAAEIAQAQAARAANRAAPRLEADPGKARRLAALYAAMPPERAASVLSPMPPEAAAEVLAAMAPAAAGAVMAAMDEDGARAVGAALAR